MPVRYAESTERQVTAAIAKPTQCQIVSLAADKSRPVSWEALRSCVGQLDISSITQAATAAFCDNAEVQITPQALLKEIVQPVRRFALSGLAFSKAEDSRMKKNIHVDSLATEAVHTKRKELIQRRHTDKRSRITGCSSSTQVQRRGGRRETDSSLRVGAPHTQQTHSSSSSNLQQRGGRRQRDSSLHNTPPTESEEETNGMESLEEGGFEEETKQEQGVCQTTEDSEWSINAYNNRCVLHMICSSSALPLCRAGRSTPAQLANPVAIGKQLVELAVLGKFSGEIC